MQNQRNKDSLLWNKCLKTGLQLRNFDGMVLDFKIYTPPLLKHNNSGCIIFSNNISIKGLPVHMKKDKKGYPFICEQHKTSQSIVE